MKIFLTGGTGFLGSIFYELLKNKHNIYVLTRNKKKNYPNFIFGNLNDEFKILSDCKVLVHFAAHGVTPKKSTLKKCIEVNVIQTMKLLNQAADQGISKFIVIGTSQEYGDLADQGSRVDVFSKLSPNTNYAKSKVVSYKKIENFCKRRNVRVSYLRVFNTYGEGQNKSSLFCNILDSIKSGEPIVLRNPNKKIDIIQAKLAISKISKYLNFNGIRKGRIKVVNIGSGRTIKVVDFVNKMTNKYKKNK